jgi:hypothetical protein
MNVSSLRKGSPNTFLVDGNPATAYDDPLQTPGQAWCRNHVSSDPHARIYFISDPSHLIKKLCNHFEKSSSKAGSSRDLRIAEHLLQMILGLHAPPDPIPRPQSETGDTVGEEWYCRVFGRLYDLMASSQQPLYFGLDGDKYTTDRVSELRATLKIVRAWSSYTAAAAWPGSGAGSAATPKERSSRFLSHQLYFDIQMMLEGFLGLLKYRERHGAEGAVCVRNLSQDSLESLFGRLRASCGSAKDPNMLKAVQVLPGLQKQAEERHERRSRVRADRTNSGRAGSTAQVVAAPTANAKEVKWLTKHRIVLPSDADFKRKCEEAEAAARQGRIKASPIRWETLRRVQTRDEKRQRAGGRKLMNWLTTSKHINKTGFSRMKVGLAVAVISVRTAQALQCLRYDPNYNGQTQQ